MKCFVLSCKNDFRSSRKTAYSKHRFPCDLERRMEWLEVFARAENRQIDAATINFRTVRVCSDHFPESDFLERNGKYRLHDEATPSLFGEEALRKGKQCAAQRFRSKCEDLPQSIPQPVKTKKCPVTAQQETMKLINGVLSCIGNQDHDRSSPEGGTVFRLEKFPQVCRLCLKAPKSETEVMVSIYATDYLLDDISVGQFISEILPAEATLDQSYQPFLPLSVCLECMDILKFFAKFRRKITIVHSLMNSLVELKQHGNSDSIVDLFNNQSEPVQSVIKDLGLCRKDNYSVEDLLQEFPRYDLAFFEGFTVKEEIETGEELLQLPVESDVMFGEECTMEELNELTNGDPDLMAPKTVFKAQYGGKKQDEPLQCSKCSYKTYYKRSFNTHQANHKRLEEQGYPCKVSGCTKVFESQIERKRHTKLGHKLLICDNCGLKCATRTSLKIHMARHQQKLEHECPYCKQRYNTKNDWRTHIRHMHVRKKGYRCETCDMTFHRKSILDDHMISHLTSYDFPCTMCNKKFKATKHLKKHVMIVHEGVQLPCRYCPVMFDTTYKLNNHIESVHGVQTRFVCDVCVRTFPSQDKLDCHRGRHDSPHELECATCLTLFASKDLLADHPCITYRDDYICCDRDLRYHYIYNKHMLMKHGIKTNVRVKPTPGLLMGQMRAQRKRIETCPKCDQIFATRTLKKQHMEICTFTGDEGRQGGNGGAEAEEAMAVEVLEEMADHFQ
nr:zinc finger protein 140-like [Aedes albopictus]